MKMIETLKNEEKYFLNFLTSNYPCKQNANLFFRDLQFAIRDYFNSKDIEISYSEAEAATNAFSMHLINKGKLKKISGNSWVVKFSESEMRNEITQM